jgi:multidrug efflux pump subunit AcrA (membrane-fusion protein)
MPVRYAARVRVPRCPRVALLLLAGPLLGTAGCGPGNVASGPAGEKPPITGELLKIEPQLLRDTATFSGQLDAEYSLAPGQTSGVVENVLFDEGQTVKKGAVLFRLRDDEQKARLAEAVANRDLADEIWDRTQQLVSRDAASEACHLFAGARESGALDWPLKTSSSG